MSDNEADTSTDQTHQETSSPNKVIAFIIHSSVKNERICNLSEC